MHLLSEYYKWKTITNYKELRFTVRAAWVRRVKEFKYFTNSLCTIVSGLYNPALLLLYTSFSVSHFAWRVLLGAAATNATAAVNAAAAACYRYPYSSLFSSFFLFLHAVVVNIISITFQINVPNLGRCYFSCLILFKQYFECFCWRCKICIESERERESVCAVARYLSIEPTKRGWMLLPLLHTGSRQIDGVCKLAKSFRTLFIALNVMSICADDLQKLYNSLFKPNSKFAQGETCW